MATSGLQVPTGDLFDELVVRQVELDGRDRDVACGDGMQVGTELTRPAGWTATDPVVVAAEWILPPDQLVVVLTPSEPRDLNSANLRAATARYIHVEQHV